MAARSISARTPLVKVEYDCKRTKSRKTKLFEDAYAARRFFVAKEKSGNNPRVLSAEKETGETKNEVDANAKKPIGVRSGNTRAYLAGKIIAKHGIAEGVTDGMVAELDEAYGKPNPTESKFCLKNAWHACRAFSGAS